MMFLLMVYCPVIILTNLIFDFTRLKMVNTYLDYHVSISARYRNTKLHNSLPIFIVARGKKIKNQCRATMKRLQLVRIFAFILSIVTMVVLLTESNIHYRSTLFLFVIASDLLVCIVNYMNCIRVTKKIIKSIN